MKRFLPILGLLLCAIPAHATIAFVNSATGSCNSNVVTTCAITYSPTAGNEIIVTADIYDGSSGMTISSVTETGASDTFTCDLNAHGPTNGAAFNIASCRVCNVSSGVTAFNVNWSASGANFWPGIVVEEFSGVSSTCLDQASAENSGSGTSASTPALTPAVSGELSIGVFFNNANAPFTGTNGWTCTSLVDPNSNTVAGCYQVISGTGSTTATATISSSQAWAAWQNLYKPSGGGATCTPTLALMGVGRCG